MFNLFQNNLTGLSDFFGSLISDPYQNRLECLERDNKRMMLKKQVLDAFRNREIQMFLQFIVRSEDGKIYGAEAISRWLHPQRGLLCPDCYIALMKSEGLISKLDFYIFEEVCRQLERWQKEGKDLILSCNFSRITICCQQFTQRICEISERYDFDHRRLIMEITEDTVETNKEAAFENIARCKEMGFLIALDDAGSGCTSFFDLLDYPIDMVKLDGSLLNAAVTRRGAALLRGVASMLHDLEMEVLCEGAETEEQIGLCREINCDYIQGYYFYRPVPPEEAEHILETETV